jgi:LPPG:FO 2-phospho-L-lactate transferase
MQRSCSFEAKTAGYVPVKSQDFSASGSVVALCGGVGGAKLALGLDSLLNHHGKGRLTVAVNCGDDFSHFGLHISPDLDTVLYSLSGLSDPVKGWGRAGETWNFMAAMHELGGDTWFSLGDRDLALHVERTRRLQAGESQTSIVHSMTRRLAVETTILPMSEDPVRTIVHTADGDLPFQTYFVKLACKPVVTGISFAGAAQAKPNPGLMEALAARDLAAVVICPSNPYLSIDPILAIPGVRTVLQELKVPVIAVSPIIGGRAVKGPTTKIMEELGIRVDSLSIANHYRGLIDGMVIDECDAADAYRLGLPVAVSRTLMQSDQDKQLLARAVLNFANNLSGNVPAMAAAGGQR